MESNFRIEEVFEMALRMEENGSQFYREAAKNATDKSVKELLEKLSIMEIEHQALFKKLKAEVLEIDDITTIYDPYSEAARYLQTVVDTRVFFNKTIDTSSVKEVLIEATWREKDTVVFYLGIRQAMSDEHTKMKLDKIIEEEMSHVRILSEKLKELG